MPGKRGLVLKKISCLGGLSFSNACVCVSVCQKCRLSTGFMVIVAVLVAVAVDTFPIVLEVNRMMKKRRTRMKRRL